MNRTVIKTKAIIIYSNLVRKTRTITLPEICFTIAADFANLYKRLLQNTRRS